MRVQRGGPRSGVFIRRQGCLQLGVLFGPICLFAVEGVRQTAPADVAGKGLLLLRRGVPALRLDVFQHGNRVHVCPELGLGAAFAQAIVGDVEILCRDRDRLLRFADAYSPHNNINGAVAPRATIDYDGFIGDLRRVNLNRRILCDAGQRKAIHKSLKALIAFCPQDRINQRGITKLDIIVGKLFYDKGFAILQIQRVAHVYWPARTHSLRHGRGKDRSFPFRTDAGINLHFKKDCLVICVVSVEDLYGRSIRRVIEAVGVRLLEI